MSRNVFQYYPAAWWVKKVRRAESCKFPIDTCMFLTRDIVDAQNFNLAPILKKWKIICPNFVFLNDSFSTKRKFVHTLKIKRETIALLLLPVLWRHCYDLQSFSTTALFSTELFILGLSFRGCGLTENRICKYISDFKEQIASVNDFVRIFALCSSCVKTSLMTIIIIIFHLSPLLSRKAQKPAGGLLARTPAKKTEID